MIFNLLFDTYFNDPESYVKKRHKKRSNPVVSCVNLSLMSIMDTFIILIMC